MICATAWSPRLTQSRQLTESELVDPDDTLPERMGVRGNNLMTFATRLSSGNKLSTLFPQNPPEGHLHIVVHHPSVGKSGSPVLFIDYCSSKLYLCVYITTTIRLLVPCSLILSFHPPASVSYHHPSLATVSTPLPHPCFSIAASHRAVISSHAIFV